MPIRSANKKIIFSVILIIFLIGGFFVWQANQAKAVEGAPAAKAVEEDPATAAPDVKLKIESGIMPGTFRVVATNTNEPKTEPSLLSTVYFIIGGILLGILKILSHLVSLGANLADYILGLTSFIHVNVVTIGWGITRGLANMFFALILLIMSIATILRIENYSIKKTLPKLVIAALLINFSLMFAGIIIDFAQVMTDYFLTAGAGEGGIAANLTNGLKIVQIYDFSQVDQGVIGAIATVLWGSTLTMVVQEFMAIILFLVAAFSFFAMSFFLIARIVWIWLLLILAPLAWISYIVPSAPGKLGSAWNDWWKSFLSWTMFAPIYAFFLYLALTIAQNDVSLGTGKWTNGADAAVGQFRSSFFDSPGTILQYIVIIMILLGGLKAARDMGVSGAQKISNWGEKAGKATAKWTAKKGTGYETWSPALMSAAGSTVGSIPGFKKVGGTMKGKAIEMREKQLGQREDKLYNNYLNSLNDKDLMDNLERGGRREKLQALKLAKTRGLLNKEDPETRKKAGQAVKTFRAYGMAQEAQEIEELMPDQIKDAKTRTEAIERTMINGVDRRWKKAVFDSNFGPEIMEQMRKFKPPAEMTAYVKGLSLPIKNAANRAIAQQIDINVQQNKSILTIDDSQDPKYKNDLDLREAYANTSGKLATAFEVPKDALPEVQKRINKEVENFVMKMKPTQIGDIDDKDTASLNLLAKYISQDIVASIRGELNAKGKSTLKDEIDKLVKEGKTDRKKIQKFMQESPAWGGRQARTERRTEPTREQDNKSPQKDKGPKIIMADTWTPIPPPEERKG